MRTSTLLCLVLLPLGGLAPSLASAQEAHAKVSFAEGAATLRAGEKLRPAEAGAAVAQGERVVTGADGRVELLLEDGSCVRVGPGSDLEVSALDFQEEGRTLRARFKLTLGKVWAHVEKLAGGGTFEVVTDQAVAGVRGTEFRVDAAATEQSVEVYQGKVAVESPRLAYLGAVEAPAPSGPAPAGGPAAPGAANSVLVEPGHHLRLGSAGMRLYQLGQPDEFHRWVTTRARPQASSLFRAGKGSTERPGGRERHKDRAERRRERK